MDTSTAHTGIRAVVCIPTFRRPEGLRATLQSLRDQTGDIRFAVVVVENDATGRAGAAMAQTYFDTDELVGAVVIEERQGNCHAINRAFLEARTRYPEAAYMLMIDDDETASPAWLATMLAVADTYDADIVGGPVVRRFEALAAASAPDHPLFGSIEAPTGPVAQIYGTGNCLVSRKVFEGLSRPELDLTFNFMGGGDTDFFTRCRRQGFRFAWAREAEIEEVVPRERTVPAWIRARSLRTGVINFTVDRKQRPGLSGYLALSAKNAVSLLLAPWRGAVLYARTGSLLAASHPLLLSLGRVAAGFGYAPMPYKAPD